MNFKATAGDHLPQTRIKKVKRVSDVNAVGPSIPTSQFIPFDATQQQTLQQNQFPTAKQYLNMPAPNQYMESTSLGGFEQIQNQSYEYSQAQSMQNTSQFQNYPSSPLQQSMMNPMVQNPQGLPSNNLGPSGMNFSQQFSMLQQPIVQDMAIQYGQKLADQGKQLVENHFEKYVPVGRLKYYFAVDNKYVINKLRLIFFPFLQKNWALRYNQENPVQPRYDVNAVDLYIPAMAYITYVVLAGLMLGMKNLFTPEHLGIQASSALAYSIFEIIIYSITLYVTNIPTNLKTLDLLAFSGYKYVIIVACLLVSILFKQTGYYIAFLYCSLSLSFFLLRTIKTKIINQSTQTNPDVGINYDNYGGPQQIQNFDYTGKKRKLYFLFLTVGIQVFLIFWLSKHLVLS